MSLYAQAVAAERAAKIERDMIDHANGVQQLRDQLAAAQAQNVLLREALQITRHGILFSHDSECIRDGIDRANEALTATADLSNLVLCDGEPVAFMAADQGGVHLSIDADKFHNWLPLFSAKEQK